VVGWLAVDSARGGSAYDGQRGAFYLRPSPKGAGRDVVSDNRWRLWRLGRGAVDGRFAVATKPNTFPVMSVPAVGTSLTALHDFNGLVESVRAKASD